jgi:L-lactate dehydrogenase complex protein LldG
MGDQPSDVMGKVRAALGRSETLKEPPAPPAIPEPITRLVHMDIGLPELFAERARGNAMGVEVVTAEEVVGKAAAFLRASACRKLALPESELLGKLGVAEGLKRDGFEVRMWPEMTLDELYDFDCGVTDVYAAVAETGSLVIRAGAGHGRGISLVPAVHVVIVQPKDIVADLVDLMEKLGREGTGSATVIITGPSKTADIEMSLVVGVHGPGKVQVYLLK